MKKKASLLELIIFNLATVFFIGGLVMINISIYHIYNSNIGMMVTGITLVIVALILNYEQSNLPVERGK